MKEFSDRLNALMESQNVTAADLVNALKIDRKAIYNYRNDRRVPPAETLIALADHFGVSLDYLVGRSGDPKIH